MSLTKKKIQLTLEEIVELRKVDQHLLNISRDLEHAEQGLNELESLVDKESEDVKDLENTTIKSLFTKVLGSQEEQLDDARREYLDVLLKYNEKKKRVELLEYEKELLSKKTASIDKLELKLKQLKALREREILSSHSNIAQELIHIANQQDKLTIYKKELLEAYKVGDKLVELIDQIVRKLIQAKDWGSWDLVGKNRYADYSKHQAIDRANGFVHEANHLIGVYQKELHDLGIQTDIRLQTENFNSFLDFFFDNLISDWIVQKKIKNSLAQVVSTREYVKELNLDIHQNMDGCKQKAIELERNRDQILEQE